MRDGLKVGNEAELVWRVQAEHVIHLGGTKGAKQSAVVFSTPYMIMLMERTARLVLQPYLESEEESVGAVVQVEHLAATPIGATVRGYAKVTRIDGRSIDFEIAAYDAKEQIGRGTHRRAVIALDRFTPKLQQKSQHLLPQGVVYPMTIEPNTGELPRLETIEVQREGSMVLVKLNRPNKLNAVNLQMTYDWELLNAWLAGHQEVRIVILTGSGNAFCAGDDVPEVGTLSVEQARELSYRQAKMYLAWEELPQIFIAAVHGVAYGGGCVAACACDLRIASHAARFAMPEVLLGWPPGYGIAQLTALIGKSRAMEMCITGEPISAQQSHQWGLVQRLVPANQLLNAAKKWGSSLLQLPSQALSDTKRLVHLDEGVQPKIAYLADTAAYVRCLELPAAQEGIRAFASKKKK